MARTRAHVSASKCARASITALATAIAGLVDPFRSCRGGGQVPVAVCHRGTRDPRSLGAAPGAPATCRAALARAPGRGA